jgi:TIGR03009 family protein
MRRDVTWRDLVLALLAIASGSSWAVAQEVRRPPSAAAQPAAAPRPAVNPVAPDPARMKRLLQEWERRSAMLSTLDVGLKRVDHTPGWDDEKFEGRAILQSPNLAFLDFKRVVEDEKTKAKSLVSYERIVCTGTEVWQYRTDAKQLFIFPLDRKDQKRALEEGPLPFLFNMKAAEAEERYEMALVTEAKDCYVISVVPRWKIDREAFLKAFLKLNKATYLPDRILLYSPDSRSSKDFTLFNVQPNAPVRNENFVGVPMGKPWTTKRDPGGELLERQPAVPPQGIGNRAPVRPAVPRR